MRKKLLSLASLIFSEPLLIEPRKLDAILAAIGDRFGIDPSPYASALEGPFAAPMQDHDRDSDSSAGIAEICVFGPLAHRPMGGIEALSGGPISYVELGAELEAAIRDPKVRGILLRIDSPGGEAAGCFDLADAILAARTEKPIVAIAEDLACSAAYALGCAADELYATQTSLVGSIGVVGTHFDISQAEAMAGIKVTHIYAGKRKVDGTPHAPLTPEAKQDWQERVDFLMGVFASHVARARGLKPEDILALEAGTFDGPVAVEHGLADGVATYREARARLAELIAARAAKASTFAATSRITTETSASPKSPTVGDLDSNNNPAAGGNEEGPFMDLKDNKSPDGANQVIDLAAEVERLRRENAKLAAKADVSTAALAEVKAKAKEKLIVSAQEQGRVTPRMLPSVEKMAESMEADELEAFLAELPVQTHPKALGKTGDAGRVRTDDDEDLIRVSRAAGLSLAAVESYGQVEAVHLDGTVTLKNGDRVPGSALNGGRA